MISSVNFLSSVRVEVFACMVQLLAFQASVKLPSHEIPETSPSPLDPSHLHISIGLASTIQFHHFIRGERPGGGLIPVG